MLVCRAGPWGGSHFGKVQASQGSSLCGTEPEPLSRTPELTGLAWVERIGSSRECQGRVHGGRLIESGRNGAYQPWTSQLVGRRVKKKVVIASAFIPEGIPPIPAPLAHALIFLNEFPFYMTQVLFKVLPLPWDSEQVCLYKSPSRVESHFPKPSSSPEHRPHWFSKPDVIGAYLPIVGPLGWGAIHGARNPRSSRGTCRVVISLLLVGCHTGGLGSDWTMPFTLPPILIGHF